MFTNGFNHNTGRALHGEHRQRRDQPGGQRCRRHRPGDPRRRHRARRPTPTASPSCPPARAASARAFTDANGVTWTFCADKPTLTTYYLPKDGKKWIAYGKPSRAVAPIAAGFPLVLPPARLGTAVGGRSISSAR